MSQTTAKDMYHGVCLVLNQKKNDIKVHKFFNWSYMVILNNKNSISFQ